MTSTATMVQQRMLKDRGSVIQMVSAKLTMTSRIMRMDMMSKFERFGAVATVLAKSVVDESRLGWIYFVCFVSLALCVVCRFALLSTLR
jgi:hypothetical protein